LSCFLNWFGEGVLPARIDERGFWGASCRPLVRWAGGFVGSLDTGLGGRELIRRFGARRLGSLWYRLGLGHSWLGKGLPCFQADRTGFCSRPFSFRLVSRGGRSLRRRGFQTFRFRRTTLCEVTRHLRGVFQGLGLHCLLLGRDALLKCKPWRLWDRMAILRQGFSRQNLERGRSRSFLPWDELVLCLAMLAKPSPPMPQAATARLEVTLLMRFPRGSR
jgi:hypothetical protein